MTTVVILPERHNGGNFRAVSGKRISYGETAGEALDALTEQLDPDDQDLVVYVQDFMPDEFFSEEQQRRLSYLMEKFRRARDFGGEFSADEQFELERLVETELEASGNRAKKLADQMER